MTGAAPVTQEVEIRRETVLAATPAEVWHAVATGEGNLGWLFPMDIEPWVGGKVSRGPSTVTEWDPPRRFASLYESADGFAAGLEYSIEALGDERSVLRSRIHYVNRGEADDLWDVRLEAAESSCDFYYHTLGLYLRYFGRRRATYVELDQESGPGPNGFAELRRRLGVVDDTAVGDAVRLTVPGLDPLHLWVEYLTAQFIGLRSAEGLYCFIGRDAWGWPIGLRLHLFGEDVDQEATEKAWQKWLEAALS
jgi:uncharacterized protein YndB with AHSA1/START domain